MFFETETNMKILGDFIRKAEVTHFDDEDINNRLHLTIEILNFIYKAPSGWDERCKFNIHHIGEEYLQNMRSFDPANPTDINYIYTMTYRFLCEYDFLVGAGRELNMDLGIIKNKIQNSIGDLPDDLMSQMIYASYVMPANITKDFLNNGDIAVFRDFEQKKNDAIELKDKWDKEIDEKKTETNNLKDKLDKYKIGYNFVGLYQGFSDLGTKKDKESQTLFWSLIAMGVIILLPLLIELSVVSYFSFFGKTLSVDHITILLPVISVEIILIYFFRIILMNYKSAKAQRMQIELRQTLCQFIQSYAEYSSKIKTQDNVALEKFENLIFSSVLSDSEKIPSTFDGLEQLGNLIKNIKN